MRLSPPTVWLAVDRCPALTVNMNGARQQQYIVVQSSETPDSLIRVSKSNTDGTLACVESEKASLTIDQPTPVTLATSLQILP